MCAEFVAGMERWWEDSPRVLTSIKVKLSSLACAARTLLRECPGSHVPSAWCLHATLAGVW